MTRPPADVTICIPAWRAEGFIGRTLKGARAQSHASVRILVSVDLCDDATEAICRAHAAEDPRIEVLSQQDRLGWADNCNALLDRVDTEFYFLYFHDDIVAPEYVERLRQRLLDEPEAAAAYCDVQRFGTSDRLTAGMPYPGGPAERMLLALCPSHGAPLRALTRSRVLANGARFPALPGSGFWRWYPYLLQLVAAGPLLHLPETLYWRWIRPEGLTADWNRQSIETWLPGVRGSVQVSLDVFRRASVPAEIEPVLRYALYLFVMGYVRRIEIESGGDDLVGPADIHPGFAGMQSPPAMAHLETFLREGLRSSLNQLLRLEREHAAKIAGP
jgi:glycosyltransferase involved in cell wall biosynthesis